MNVGGDTPTDLSLQFVDSVPEDFQCCICLNAATDAVVTEDCGHLFCRECTTFYNYPKFILTAIEQKNECPVDRLPLTMEQIRKDVRAQRKIQSLCVYCPNKESGCNWMGYLSDLPHHATGCDHGLMKCPFASHGCTALITKKTIDQHLSTEGLAHSLLMCKALDTLSLEYQKLRVATNSFQRMLMLAMDSDYFIWSIPMFEQQRGAEVSKIFKSKGLNWYMKIDFEENAQFSAVYLYASAHTKRTNFEFLLFNQDSNKDECLLIDDWAIDFKGKGWGNKRFIDRTTLADSGFIIDGRVTIGVHMVGEPF
eukprot:NODE_4759_length_1118_cov_43.773869_g4223_i0.p1 GENE.NODE_4759_length_1118_cov_43.773869_g4223_i0~~NODE_4759_length_1118_cov_43.773869_g4223_i0.p1  ORF type:complete len:310 (+),score=50.96 NODE_4759_length_1118_cov_43.773869_g4223_i0:70-999(+)